MDHSPLPVLPFWQARSFWATLIAALSALGSAFGLDMGWLTDDPALADKLLAVIAAVAALWAWAERLRPRYKLGVRPE